MRSLTVSRAGPSMTIQDPGRAGLQRFGVAEGGAVDHLAHVQGAVLLRQPASAASVEMALMGGTFRAGAEPLTAVVTGAVMPTTVDGRVADHGTVFVIPPGVDVAIGAAISGVYGYLSIAGGVDVPPVLGSRSTHVRAGFGGLEGRRLQQGDALPIGIDADANRGRRLAFTEARGGPMRFVRGLHADLLGESVRHRLEDEPFVMTSHRDRMGARIESAAPLYRAESDRGTLSLPSSPVVLGDIQVPGDGHPVVLLADRQPTGGYPRIGTVITADIGRFVQTPIGAEVRFISIAAEAAAAVLRSHLAHLASLEDAVVVGGSDSSADLSEKNLISGFTVGDEEAQ